MEAELRGQCDKLIDRLLHAFDYMDPVDSDYARQVAREIAGGLSDTLAAQAAELEGLRNAPVVELDASGDHVLLITERGELDNAILSARVCAMHGQRVRLVPDTALADSDATNTTPTEDGDA